MQLKITDNKSISPTTQGSTIHRLIELPSQHKVVIDLSSNRVIAGSSPPNRALIAFLGDDPEQVIPGYKNTDSVEDNQRNIARAFASIVPLEADTSVPVSPAFAPEASNEHSPIANQLAAKPDEPQRNEAA